MSLDFQGSWSHEFLKEFKKMNEKLAAISEKLSPTPAKKVTLVYSPGAYATDEDVPESVTVDAGTEVEIEFYPYPSRDGYSFVGWAMTDGASEAEFVEKDTDTITMTEDVTLYPVFEQAQLCTVTYAMGEYADGGDVPDSQSVEAGGEIEIQFNPHPTRTDYDFIGWAASDGAEDPLYDVDGSSTAVISNDKTLYPVFSAPDTVTLTYAMGDYSDGGGVPDPVTDERYENVSLEFSPHPTKDGYSFVGWATSDGASSAQYYEDMDTPTIYLDDDITLYPVFAEGSEGGNDVSIVIDNQCGGDCAITDSSEIVLLTVGNGDTETFTGSSGETYKIRVPGSVLSSLNGTYKGATYTNESMTHSTHEGYDWIDEPTSSQSSIAWEPSSGDDFTISVTTK